MFLLCLLAHFNSPSGNKNILISWFWVIFWENYTPWLQFLFLHSFGPSLQVNCVASPHLRICLCDMNKPWNWNLLTRRVLALQVYHWSKCIICNRFLSELFLLHKYQVLCSHTIKFYLWLESSEVITTNTLRPREVKWLPQCHQLFGDKEGNRNCLSQIYNQCIFIILSYLL